MLFSFDFCAAARVWSPFKDLQDVVESAIHRHQTEAVHDLEVMLKRHKTDFLSLLKNNVGCWPIIQTNDLK